MKTLFRVEEVQLSFQFNLEKTLKNFKEKNEGFFNADVPRDL